MARSERPHGAAREQRWRQTVARWRASGLRVRDFCDREGLSEPSFYQWRRRLAQEIEAPSTPPDRGRFLPVRIVDSTSAAAVPAPASTTIDVILGNGRRLAVHPGFPASTLLQLVQLLEELPC